MGWMKVHYDMLRMIGSKSHTNADNGEITIVLDEEDAKHILLPTLWKEKYGNVLLQKRLL